MEAVGDLAAGEALRWAKLPAAGSAVWPPSVQSHAGRIRGLRSVPVELQDPTALGPDGGGSGDLARCLALLKTLSATAVADTAMLGFRESADFAANVEEISRAVEYLQIVAAGAVDRTRRQAAAAARSAAVGSGSAGSGAAVGWTTGWGTDPAATGGPGSSAAPDPADDGYRNAPEFLRARLRISAAEARRRISLAAAVLPRTGFTGHTEPAERPELAAALAAGTVGSRPATIITLALDRVRHHAREDITARMEHALTRTAAERDTDFLTRIARQWSDAIDQDGSEPSEEELCRRQGAFLRPARRGLHHLEIFATPDQYESLLTVMNTATNPRTRPSTTEGNDADTDATTGAAADTGTGMDSGSVAAHNAAGDDNLVADTSAMAGKTDGQDGAGLPDTDLDRRTRPQRLLDGLIGACKAALATGTLPAAGGLRPQVMVTIDYRDLLDRLEHTTAQGPRYRSRTADTSHGWDSTGGSISTEAPACGEGPLDTGDHTGHGCDSTSHADNNGFNGFDGFDGFDGFESVTADHGCDSTIPGTGSFTFTGPVPAAMVRKIACDADIIPVLLGSEGRVLDIGRTTRIFPPHIRKAITTRDQGCAFPGCTIPAPWCEAHHITYWSHGGPTSTDNGTLLCSHHHHLIHKEQWTIQVKTGIPWFKPPPHIDPRQQPQRNHRQT